MRKCLFVIVVVLISLVSNAQIEKNIVHDPNALVKNVKNFKAVEVSGAIDLYLSQGSEEAVAVSASSKEMAAKIKTQVRGGVLVISVEDGNSWKSWGNSKMKAYITFKNLENIKASGACNVKAVQAIKEKMLGIELSGASDFVGQVEVNTLNLDASGASNIKINGSATNCSIDASGACSIKGYDLKTQVCKADASGASSIRINVSKELNADASGGSSIYYKGACVIKQSDASGGATIKRIVGND